MRKLKKNQDGIGQIAVIILIVVVIAVVGVIVWQATKKSSPTNTSTSTTTKSTTTAANVSSACQKVYKDSSLCAFAEHTNLSTTSYVATGTVVNGTSGEANYTVSNDGKGNTEVSYTSNGKTISEITLDGVTYVQAGTGTTWLEYPSGSTSGITAPNPVSGFNLNFNTSTPAGVSVTKQSNAACGDYTCYKYEVKVASEPNTTELVYFDTSSYLLRQWSSNDTSTKTSIDLVFDYKPVTITKPSPVQSV